MLFLVFGVGIGFAFTRYIDLQKFVKIDKQTQLAIKKLKKSIHNYNIIGKFKEEIEEVITELQNLF